MTRVAVCGASLAAAAAVLGLEAVDERPELVLVDLGDPLAVARSAAIPPEVPRVAVAPPEHELLLRAAGCGSVALARSPDPAVVGPLIASSIPERRRRPTRLVVVTSASGGAGRTLLAVNLATRLAARSSVLLVDATGSGAAGWWLRLAPASWSDLEGLVDELAAEHLAIVAAERERLRMVGGASAMPSVALLLAAVRAADALSELVIVDAPSILDERTRALSELADRVLVLAVEEPAALAALDGGLSERTWLVASRSRAPSIGGHAAIRSLPSDPGAVRAAARGPSAVGGALGSAYDDLAELIAIDAQA